MTNAQIQDIAVGLSLLLLALLGLFILIPHGIMLPGKVEIAALSPSFWPNIILYGLALAGTIIFLQGILKPQPTHQTETGTEEIAFTKVGICIGSMFIYYWTIQYIGIVLSSCLAIVGLTLLGGECRWRLILAIACLLPLALYYFFTVAANIPLPLGVFETWR